MRARREQPTLATALLHRAQAPGLEDDDLLPLFGYVVSVVRESHLPSEYALIPFVESAYRPGARSPHGPAGLWQLIAITARNHDVPIRNGYDGRLSPIDSTRAAVRYLKTLHGMFAGDWRLAVMAYNAGEYRVLGALKRNGQVARSARPEQLTGLSDITQAYVRKLHALSCLLEQADDKEEWLQALDRPVPRLEALPVPVGIDSIGEWASPHRPGRRTTSALQSRVRRWPDPQGRQSAAAVAGGARGREGFDRHADGDRSDRS